MHSNVGGVDRLARYVFGPVLVVVGAAVLLGVLDIGAGRLGVAVAVAAAAVGGVFVLTATVGWCPLNALAGFDTSRGQKTTAGSEAAGPERQRQRR